MTRTGRNDGFTLAELLLVVTIMLIVAAIAVPGFSRARAASFETSTVAALRGINTAQASFATACASGFYAPSLAWLTRPPNPGGEPFISPEFGSNTVDRQAYRIRYRRGGRAATGPRTCNGLGPRRTVEDYFVGADPRQRRRGIVSRHFASNSSGMIYQSTRRIRPFYSGSPPAPARPIE